MLEALGRFDTQFRWLIVAAWIVGAIAANRFLPSLASVAQSNNVVFLSVSAPSQRAATLAAPFRTTNATATAVIVAARPDGPLTTDDHAAVDSVEQTVSRLPGVLSVVDQGSSADGEARRTLSSSETERGGGPRLK